MDLLNLIKKAKKGDDEAFYQLMQMHKGASKVGRLFIYILHLF
ncbi:hypothetical protein [Cytobacillus purgationiresistens]|uniref:Uncharacterized protein n=1 Tax=Cytobacillus purgationiresistens TaxID=863449 RepID=A0ABU0ANQ9_9BACI|nr:hypothetical protein [Cytobacillus purgationiresistens]MDQ0272494.1 hypothetical protein [Cytobacillus purgationiresistens]